MRDNFFWKIKKIISSCCGLFIKFVEKMHDFYCFFKLEIKNSRHVEHWWNFISFNQIHWVLIWTKKLKISLCFAWIETKHAEDKVEKTDRLSSFSSNTEHTDNSNNEKYWFLKYQICGDMFLWFQKWQKFQN